MEHALRSWHAAGGRETHETVIAEMPFESLLRADKKDPEMLARIESIYHHWQELVCAADALDQEAKVPDRLRVAARKRADEFRALHEDDFALLTDLQDEDVADEYDWQHRMQGVRLVFRWILAEGFHPLKIMKRLYAVGRAAGIEPFTQLTMEEQGMMFSETKASVSWRMKMLSGLINMRHMAGKRLPGQKSPHSSASYSVAQEGNKNRANGKRAPRQASFLRTLHVQKTKSPTHP